MTMVMVMMVMSMMKVLTGVTMMMLITLSELRRKGGLEQGAGADPQEGDRGKVSTLCRLVQNFTELCKLLRSFTRLCTVSAELCKIVLDLAKFYSVTQNYAKLCRVGGVVYKLSIFRYTVYCGVILLYHSMMYCVMYSIHCIHWWEDWQGCFVV